MVIAAPTAFFGLPEAYVFSPYISFVKNCCMKLLLLPVILATCDIEFIPDLPPAKYLLTAKMTTARLVSMLQQAGCHGLCETAVSKSARRSQ